MRKGSKWVTLGLVGWLTVNVLSLRAGEAFFLDDSRTLFLTGSFYTQLRLRTEENQRYQVNVGDWTMMQHRYFVDPQLRASVLPWLQNSPLGADVLEALRLDEATFFFNPRFEYEGVYDYGPDAYRDQTPVPQQKVNRFDLYEMYGVLGFFNGRFNLKVGRQNLSWGETTAFRLIDRINPLDARTGGSLIPLDERRLPLMMVRATLGLGDMPAWDVYNIALEAFIAPDKRIPQAAPGRTPFGVLGAPSPPGFPPTLTAELGRLAAMGRSRAGNQLDRPDVSLGDSRMGVRLLWTWRDASFTLAHMSTYADANSFSQALRLNREGRPYIKLGLPNMQITGMTVSRPLPAPFTYTVFRSEIAGFFGEPVFIEKENFSLHDPELRQGNGGGPLPKRDMIRGVIGLDHSQWIRALNPTQTFAISGQFFYTNILGSMQGLKIPRADLAGRFTDQDRESFLNTLSVSTNYSPNYFFNLAQLQPSLALQYDWEGATLIQPALLFLRDPWRFRIEYSWIGGQFTSIGFNKDKDNLAFRIDYLLY